MKCEHAQELISARINHENQFEGDALNEHLKGCPDCCKEQEELIRLEDFLWRAYAPERDAAQVLVDKVKAALQARGRSVRRCTVLVVDDEAHILNIFRNMLTQQAEEFDVILAGSALEAQKMFGRGRDIDIILTDQRMPGMSGIELLEWVVAHHPRTKRLLITAYEDFQEMVEAINRGHVYRLLPKQARHEVIVNDLRGAARLLQLERDHERILRELSELNVQLEERVRQRTRELEEANRELEQRTQTLEKFALTDALTLLPNRHALDHFVERELYLCHRFPAALTVAMIDVDKFKSINDKFLHTAGDMVLRELAKCLTTGLRKIDVLGRQGGEEFMLIAPQTHRPGALVMAERLRAQVEHHVFTYGGQRIPVTVSIGLVVVEAGRPATYEQIKKAVALALKHAKENGRNRVEIVSVVPEGQTAEPDGQTDEPPGPQGIASA